MTTPTTSSTRSTRSRLARATTSAACTLALLLTAACGPDTVSDESSTGADDAAGNAFPATVASGPLSKPTDLTIESEPQSIVSLSPTATETLWAIDAADQVVAVDDESDYPEGVPTTKLSGFQPNVEAILGYSPDLVVAASDSDGLVSGLAKAGVPVLLLPAPEDLDEAWSQMERLGAATGHVDEAEALVSETQDAVEDAAAKAEAARGMTYFHELDSSLYTVTGDTFIGQVYDEFGLTSIADAADSGDAYPQLNQEYVVSADPDLVVLTDTGYGDVTVDNVAERPGWSDLSAVKGDHVIEVDPDIASRWGPRLAEFAELIGAQAEQLAAG